MTARSAISMLGAALLVAGCVASPVATDPPGPPAPQPADPGPAGAIAPTRILDEEAADRLRRNSGITLQWIGWDRRGTARVRVEGGVWRIDAMQQDDEGVGALFVEGRVTEIGSDYFLLDGVVRILDAPDPGRMCERDKLWRFAITQNRKYWRLREFEWCDGLTDYVDIYF